MPRVTAEDHYRYHPTCPYNLTDLYGFTGEVSEEDYKTIMFLKEVVTGART